MAEELKPLGVLILHGFTGSHDTVRPVVPVAEQLGLPWRMPYMRGHGTRYQDLVGVKPRDWYDDAEVALLDLLKEVKQVVVVGLSMGGLVSLNLGMHHGDRIAGLVLLTPALRFASPLIPFTPVLKMLFTFWDNPGSFADKRLEKSACTNYAKFPTATFARLLEYSHEVEARLGEVKVPVTTLYSHKDTTIHPIICKLLAETLGSKEKDFVYFDKSGHEMLQDCESAAVAAAVGTAIAKHLAAVTAQPASA